MGLGLLLLGCVEYGLEDPDSAVVQPVTVTEHFVQEALPVLDVLFVVDGTGSMLEEQAQLGAAAADFLEGLGLWKVSWQIGVTSMDVADGGALVGRPWILTPSSERADQVLASSLQLGTDHLPPSSGFSAALAALSPENEANHGFHRADAALHVVFVSDGDDQSATGEKERFLQWMEEESQRSGRVAMASAVVGDVPDGCTSASGKATPGTQYVEVAAATGGVAQSICSADFGAVAAVLGDQGMEWQTRFSLQAVPDAGSVVVYVDAERVSDWAVEGATLVFEVAPPPGAEIRVQYALGGS